MKATLRVAIGLLAVVSLVAASGAKSPSTRRARPARGADSVLVRIGNDAITSGQVQRRLEELPEHVRPQFTTPEGRQRLGG